MAANSGDSFSLMIHGGAGEWKAARDEKNAHRYLARMHAFLEQGRKILAGGGSALQAVETCAALLEDDPLFNAGRGSVLNAEGRVEMDAAIMDGRDLSAGAVAAISHVANPVRLARQIMRSGEHVLLVGDGAMRVARQAGMTLKPDVYFITAERRAQWARVKKEAGREGDRPGTESDTIGVVARDRAGNLAAATSTGGTVNKPSGRVGDSPLIGAGLFADNQSGAVSTTGHGEDIMRFVLARVIVDYIGLRDRDGGQAVAAAMAAFGQRLQGRGGAIVIDRAGRCAAACSMRRMLHGWIEHGGQSVARF